LASAAQQLASAKSKALAAGQPISPDDAEAFVRQSTGGKFGAGDAVQFLTQQAAGPPQSKSSDWSTQIGDQATLGLVPKANAAITGLMAKLQGQDYTPAYEAERDKELQQFAAAQQRHPLPLWARMGASFLAPIPGAGPSSSLLGAAAKGAATAGLMSTAQAAGKTVGGPADYTRNILKAGIPSVVFGSLLGAAGKGAGDFLASRAATPGQQALGPALEATSPSGSTSPSAMLADEVPSVARAARGLSPEAQQTIDQGLTARSAQQVPRIQETLENVAGLQRGDMNQSIQAIIERQRQAAQALYPKAYASPDIPVEDLPELKLPQFQAAYATGQRIAQTEGVKLPDLPQESNAGAFAKQFPGVDITAPGGQRLFQAWQSTQPNAATTAIPIQALDYMKRGLDDMIRPRLGSVNTIGRQEGAALSSRLSDMLDRVDQQAPAYAAARGAFAGDARLLDAADAGQKFLTNAMSPADVRDAMAQLGPGEQQIARKAALDQLMTRLEAAQNSATGKADLVSKFYSSIGGQAKVQALFGSGGNGQQLDQALKQIMTEQGTAQFVMGGSQTADKAAAQAAFGGTGGPSPLDLIHAAKHPAMAALTAAGRMAAQRAQTNQSTAATSMAPLLVQQNPDAVRQSVMQALATAAQRSALAQRAGNRLAGAAGNVTGALTNGP
jgi:hypothetical protein